MAALVLFQEPAERVGAHERRIPVEHEQRAARLLERFSRAHHGVAGAALLGLQDEAEPRGKGAVERGTRRRLDLFGLMADDDENLFGFELSGGAQHVSDERPATEPVQNFRLLALHASAEAGSQHQDVDRFSHWFVL
jgi:hypothetical protein